MASSAPEQKKVPTGKVGALAAILGSAALAYTVIGDLEHDEGVKLHAYRDIAGIVTGCGGVVGPNIKMGMTWTKDECADMDAGAVITHAKIATQCVPALREVGREQQLRAAVRFQYNLGSFCRGPGARMKTGNWISGCNVMLAYNKARTGPYVIENGKRVRALQVSRGLDQRRHRDNEICLTGLVPGRTPANLPARLKQYGG